MKLFTVNILSFATLLLSLVSHNVLAKSVNIDFAIAQKLILDLRYYCPDKSHRTSDLNEQQRMSDETCKEPLTQLPEELKTMISSSGLGGVILFADNLSNPTQIKQLTSDLRQAGLANKYQIPLFISVDQEGGRVVRLPMQYSTSFSGNMAIGATFKKHGTKFATETGKVIGIELRELGFNVNHAPNVDVNVNPNNPVINVRSFSESAQVVSELGNAQLEAMQAQGIIGTLKHFPGHGDTNVDSHTGLPRVDHSLEEIRDVDLRPFQYVIDRGNADMIMTAHIQYPSLDQTTLVNKEGGSMIKPATMSRKILTDTLREKMGFKGVIITDALDMRGISSFFTETDAVIHTFQAGADIALMPIKIRRPEDIKNLKSLVTSVKQALNQGKLSQQELIDSYRRIAKLKQKITKTPTKKSNNVNKANKDTHHKIEQELAIASLTVIKGSGRLNKKKVHFIMPDPNKCFAMANALAKQTKTIDSTCTDYLSNSYQQTKVAAEKAEAIVVASIEPKQSLAEIGGLDNITDSLSLTRQAKWRKSERKKQLRWLMRGALLQGKQVVFVSLRAPYEASEFKPLATDIIATYSYTHDKQLSGPVYSALARLFSGDARAQGTLPVTIN